MANIHDFFLILLSLMKINLFSVHVLCKNYYSLQIKVLDNKKHVKTILSNSVSHTFILQVEKFKSNQSPEFALHSSFDMVTGDPVYGDLDYHHLQVKKYRWFGLLGYGV